MITRKKGISFLNANFVVAILSLIFVFISCKHDPDIIPAKPVVENPNQGGGGSSGGNGNNNSSTCDPDSVYFETQVLPLLISNCAKSGCHTAADHRDGVVLNNFNNIMTTGDIDPGRADHSDLYEMITETDPSKRMPPPPLAPLSGSQIDLIFNWIQQGAQNNTCSNSCDTTNVTFSNTIFPIIQNNCLGCHSGATPGGQINLSTHGGVQTVAFNGKLFGAVNRDPGFQPMPRGGNKLADCQIDQIRIWIAQGALNN